MLLSGNASNRAGGAKPILPPAPKEEEGDAEGEGEGGAAEGEPGAPPLTDEQRRHAPRIAVEVWDRERFRWRSKPVLAAAPRALAPRD